MEKVQQVFCILGQTLVGLDLAQRRRWPLSATGRISTSDLYIWSDIVTGLRHNRQFTQTASGEALRCRPMMLPLLWTLLLSALQHPPPWHIDAARGCPPNRLHYIGGGDGFYIELLL